jgi:hypothetical protein
LARRQLERTAPNTGGRRRVPNNHAGAIDGQRQPPHRLKLQRPPIHPAQHRAHLAQEILFNRCFTGAVVRRTGNAQLKIACQRVDKMGLAQQAVGAVLD